MKRFFVLLTGVLTFVGTDVLMSFQGNDIVFTQKANAQGPSMIKMIKAKNKFKSMDFYGALRIYRELYDEYKNDAKLNYQMGECYFELNDWDEAINHFSAAVEVDEEVDELVYYNLGRAYNKAGKLDSALTAYNKFLEQEKIGEYHQKEANSYIQKIENAKEFRANPVPVEIKNMDAAINSKYDDYHPSVTADGKLMIFTSRRGEAEGALRDPHDQGYYEDVYITFFNDTTKKWEQAVPVPGGINTEEHDANLSITPDGGTMFLYMNDPKTGGDIYYSNVSSTGRWRSPRPLEKPINTDYFESYASQTADGNYLYFCSERAKDGPFEKIGFGNGDIYVAEKTGRHEYSKPENLGPTINTEEDEISVYIHPDGKTLFFSSKGHKGMGGYDIFMSKKQQDSTWSEPQNMGYPINTIYDDKDFTLSTDGNTAYYCTVKENGFGLFDIYEVDMSNYNPLKEESENKVMDKLSILKGVIVDSKDASKVEATVQIKDTEGNLVNKTSSDEEGKYFITLPGDKEYEIHIEKEGFKPFSEKVKLELGEYEVFTLEKVITLDRVPEKEE